MEGTRSMLPSDKNTASLHRFVLSFSVLNHSLNALKSVCRLSLDAFTDKQMDTEENIKGNNLLFSRGDELLSCCVEMTKLVFSLLIDTGIEKKKRVHSRFYSDLQWASSPSCCCSLTAFNSDSCRVESVVKFAVATPSCSQIFWEYFQRNLTKLLSDSEKGLKPLSLLRGVTQVRSASSSSPRSKL